MRRITKMFKSLLLLSLVLLMTNCATEEIGQKNVSQSSTEAKIWFDSHQKDYNATVLSYIGSLQWQNAIISEGEQGEIIEVPFTLTSNLSATTKEADQYDDHHRLMFIKDEQNGFKLFYIQILTNDENYKIQDKNYNYYNIKDTFNGKIFVQELATNAGTKIEFKKGKKLEPSLTAKYSENEIQCVYYGYWYEDGHFEPLYEVGCYASGGSEPQYLPAPDYGGGTTTNPSESCPVGYIYKLGECIRKELPPSCESFNFTSKKGANWQEALVKNIYFRIVIIDDKGIYVNHVVSFPQGVLFGMPINLNKGNGDITAGAAATVSAMVLKKVMDAMDIKYGRTDVSDLILTTEFRSLLINEYRMYTNGGTVNFTSTSTLPATNYKTNANQTGICD